SAREVSASAGRAAGLKDHDTAPPVARRLFEGRTVFDIAARCNRAPSSPLVLFQVMSSIELDSSSDLFDIRSSLKKFCRWLLRLPARPTCSALPFPWRM